MLAFYLGLVIGTGFITSDNVTAGDLLVGVIDVIPMTLFFAALAFCITGLRSGRGLALAVTIGFAALSYLVDAFAQIADLPAWLQRLSPWYYYGGGLPLQDGLDLSNVVLLLAVALVLVGIGTWGFERRDVQG